MNLITGKDLNYISDILDQNYIFMKKCIIYSNMLTDDNLTNEMRNIYRDHKKQHEKILNLLK